MHYSGFLQTKNKTTSGGGLGGDPSGHLQFCREQLLFEGKMTISKLILAGAINGTAYLTIPEFFLQHLSADFVLQTGGCPASFYKNNLALVVDC
jgi:hypothetical protein